MRATHQEQTGSVGVHQVAAKFGRIGWGTAQNPEHDLGTDLYLAPRDERLIELGLIAGAQVKAGPSYFREETRGEDGMVLGWWYREGTRKHFDYWLEHRAPHFLVLHHLDRDTSYWVLVTDEAVEFLNKGAKIFIPADQTIDHGHADAMITAVGTRYGRQSWEGSSWTGAVNLSPTHVYRHALLVPRLVAPHPNQSVKVVTAAQAISLVVLGRDWRYSSRLGESDMPDITQVDANADWEWQLAAALRRLVVHRDLTALETVFNAAREPHEQAASAVVLAAAHIERGEPQAAADVTQRVLVEDNLEVVDHGWVRLQHARARFEVGDFDAARATTFDLVNLGSVVPGDVTAAAISGAAANLLFAVADWDDIDFGKAVAAADTAALWWRQEVTMNGLGRQADEAFKAWAHDTQRVYSMEQPWDDLRAASLMAGFLGDHRGWVGALGRLARYVLTHEELGADAEHIRNALDIMRSIGADKNLQVAVRRLTANGPAAVVKDLADQCDLQCSTVTSFPGDLALLTAAADLLDAGQATSVAAWARHNFDNPKPLQDALHVTRDIQSRLAELLAQLVEAIPRERHADLLDWTIATTPETPGLTARPLRDLVNAIPDDTWTLKAASGAADRADTDPDDLKYAWLRAAARHLPHVRARLAEEARNGSARALAALGPVTAFDAELVVALIDHYAKVIDDRDQEATGRRFDDDHDADSLALLNIWHPDRARWGPLFTLLDTAGPDTSLESTLTRLAAAALNRRLPEDVVARLRPLAHRLTTVAPAGNDPLVTDNRSNARYLCAALDRGTGQGLDPVTVRTLLEAGPKDRQTIAILCGEPDPLGDGVLTALTSDPDPSVRASAASAVTHRALRGDQLGLTLLATLLHDAGTRVPMAVARELRHNPTLDVYDLAMAYVEHPSAIVRNQMAHAALALLGR